MSKQSFTQTVEQLFQANGVEGEVLDYFVKNYKTARKNSRELERADAIKAAILSVLKEEQKLMDRNEIGQKVDSLVEASFIRNSKGHVSFNSITSFANQLVEQGLVSRQEVRERKAKRVKYQVV
jgi:hypothetical protein